MRNYVMVLCNDFMGILFFLFWTIWCSFNRLCDVKSFKISTAYDVWFSRYRPSNLMITADFALVLVFRNFLWAVYDIGSIEFVQIHSRIPCFWTNKCRLTSPCKIHNWISLLHSSVSVEHDTVCSAITPTALWIRLGIHNEHTIPHFHGLIKGVFVIGIISKVTMS